MDKPITQQRERFEIARFSAQPNEIEIAAITAGSGDGWQFSAEVLRASLGLWDGVECFVDHAWPPRSVRDLAGVCTQPCWDDALQGIRVKVTPCGPSASVLEAMAEVKNSSAVHPRVGFSADLVFSAVGDQVTRIEKVYSVDLVAYPARGGGFLETSANQPNSINQEVCMESNEVQQVSLASSTLVEERKTPQSAASAPPAPVDPSTATTEDRESFQRCLRHLHRTRHIQVASALIPHNVLGP